MPSLPLYEPRDACPDAWHRVIAPGGYEWWRLHAQNETSALRLVVDLFDGFACHPVYLRRFRRYRRNPTRCHPPLPGDYPGLCFALYERGRALVRDRICFPRGSLSARREALDVALGPTRLMRDSDGTLRLHMRTSSRRHRQPWPPACATSIQIDLLFHPLWLRPPAEVRSATNGPREPEHLWLISAPLCRVEGEVCIGSGGSSRSRLLPFRGLGSLDHRYGTGPLDAGRIRTMRGGVLFEESACAFELSCADARSPAQASLVEANGAGVQIESADRLAVAWARPNLLLPARPLVFEIADRLRLEHPRIIGRSARKLELEYRADWRGRRGVGFCTIIEPRRLRWPIGGTSAAMPDCC